MDANQRECLDEHLICVYLCPFAVENSTSRFVFFNKDFVRIAVLSKVGFQSPTKFHEEPFWFFTDFSGNLIAFSACKSSLVRCWRGIAAGRGYAVFRLKLGTTNTRAEVCSTAFKRNLPKWKP